MNSFAKGMFAAIAAMSVGGIASAKVRVPPIFSDHMVLQAGQSVAVWGTADAGEQVTVDVGGAAKSATASADGKWAVTLDPLTSGQAVTLTIKGQNTITVHDALAGEVWLCSGQSNMVLPVDKAADFPAEKAAADWPKIRTFVTTKWVICSPDTVAKFSAVAYYFGREVHKKLGAPIGLINRAAGGTPITLWTSKAAQEAVPALQSILDGSADAPAAGKDAAQADIDRKQAQEVEGKQAAGAAKHPPGYLFEDRIVPLMPFTIRGVVWYQGEADSYTAHANLYATQLSTMIADWRKQWGSDFAFVTVQLPELGKPQTDPVEDSGRAWVRDGVFQSLSLPNTGIAVTLGTGEAANNHPKNKQEVGRRLAAWALANVYGQKDVVGSGPIAQSVRFGNGSATIEFAEAAGLTSKDGPPKGFAIAGDDGKWHWADAKIDGATVIVSSDAVKKPTAVRYGWAGNPAECNLFNGAGLPASPFRSDGLPTSPKP